MRSGRRRLIAVLLAATAVLVTAGVLATRAAEPDGPGFSIPRWGGEPAAPRTTAPPSPPLVAAVGDLVCDPDTKTNPDGDGDGLGPRQCQQRAVSDLILDRHPTAFLALGDTQYAHGSLEAYRANYAPTYGRLLDITHPVPGNHEYETQDAAGYYAYFGDRAVAPGKGYYSYDLGAWHIVALNSNCDQVSCEAGGEQERWLRDDLARHRNQCTLAYSHHPRWSHGEHGDNPPVGPLYEALYDARVDLLLSGHDHDYERYIRRDPAKEPDEQGVRQFVVGTGGRNVRAVERGKSTEAMDDQHFGALFLTLSPTGYSWTFDIVGGGSTDSGSATCLGRR